MWKPLNPMIRDWHGLRVWIIGGSSGIGYSTAQALHLAGASVVVSSRNTKELDKFVAAHPSAQSLVLDATDESSIKLASEHLLLHGPLDFVFYCAAKYSPMRAQSLNTSEIAQHLHVNYLGACYALQSVLPHMLSRKSGHFSLVASVAGFSGLPFSLAYGPTKAALINLAESLYIDCSPHGVGISVVNPGFVKTPLTSNNQFPMPALITPSEAASYIVKGLAKGEFEIHFPKRFTLLLKFLRLIPYRFYFYLLRKVAS